MKRMVNVGYISQADALQLLSLSQRFLAAASLRQAEICRQEVNQSLETAISKTCPPSKVSDAKLMFARSARAYVFDHPERVCTYAIGGIDASTGLGPVIENDNRQFKEALKGRASGSFDLILYTDCQNREVDIKRVVTGIEHQLDHVHLLSNALLAQVKQVKPNATPSNVSLSVFARRTKKDARQSRQSHIRFVNLRTQAAAAAAVSVRDALEASRDNHNSSGSSNSSSSSSSDSEPLYADLVFSSGSVAGDARYVSLHFLCYASALH